MPGVDFTSTTVRLDDGVICRGAQCEAFASITCAMETPAFRMPTLGSSVHTTVLEPGLRDVEAAIEPAEFQVLIPGCHQREPGVFLCETVLEYQHCRTLMGDPELIMVDEPTEGLAPKMVEAVSDLLQRIASRGVAILLVEQKLTIALTICHRLYVMGHGRIVFEGAAADLRANDAVRKEWLEV